MSRLSFEINATSLALHLSFHTFQPFPQAWDETFQRVTNEQEIYEGDPFPSFLFRIWAKLQGADPDLFSGCSPTSWPDAAEARELLSDHHYPTNQPLHPVHRQGEREAWAQVAVRYALASTKINGNYKWCLYCHTCSWKRTNMFAIEHYFLSKTFLKYSHAILLLMKYLRITVGNLSFPLSFLSVMQQYKNY